MLRKIVQGFSFVGVVLGVGALGAGCLDRPVTNQAPTIKTNFTSAVNQSGIDKVDILFDIDNSASMGDKQQYLIEAIPQMIARLVTPNCIYSSGTMAGQTVPGVTADPSTGLCPTGEAPEFTAVHDMHIGVVTSSLGTRLGVTASGPPVSYVCDPTVTVMSAAGVSVSAFNDDQGHLINRTGPYGSGAALSDATLSAADGNGGFLYWFPTNGNSGKTPVSPPVALTMAGAAGTAGTLTGDFTELVSGAGESGCGIESQLESWYRFLVQPDPYNVLINDPTHGNAATWSGVDTTILQQRHDFLRPDSLVAVIVLSDENDSEIDVRSYGGTGYYFMSNIYNPPRATTACGSVSNGPNDPACVSCGTTQASKSDPACLVNDGAYTSTNDGLDWGYNLNLRHVHMQQKYGLNPQYPLTRYFNGLTSTTVPNRLGEYPLDSNGDPGGSYVGTNNCTNPLFAATLPEGSAVPDATAKTPAEVSTTLCQLTAGSVRTPADVFFAHIGGVPHQLLQSTPGDGTCAAGTAAADCPQKDTLLQSDWVKILGQGPAAYTGGTQGSQSFDYTGIDPHMVESMTPRNVAGLPNSEYMPTTDASGTNALSGPALGAGNVVNPDPVNGREWTTNAGTHSLPVDREYACTFQLPNAYTDATGAMHANQQRDCATLAANTIEGNSCDCVPGGTWSSGGAAAATGNTTDEIPPLCALQSTDGTIKSSVNDYTVQTYAKAYPTIRELMLANMMGGQGIVSSLCPIHTTDMTGVDPLYGYRPAVNAIVNRLKSALGSQCVPPLTPTTTTTNGVAGETVPCLVLVSFSPTAEGAPTTEAGCVNAKTLPGYTTPAAGVLQEFQQSQAAAVGDAGGTNNLAKEITCQLNQVPIPASLAGTAAGTCTGGDVPGWCYVTGAAVSGGSTCSQAIVYSAMSGVVPDGATISLQCISSGDTTAASSGSGSGSASH